MKRLEQLLAGLEVLTLKGSVDRPVTGVHIDSRQIEPDNCFVAIEGFKQTGLEYVDDAVKRGAGVVVSEGELPAEYPRISWIQVRNARQAASKLSAAFFDNPTREMYVVGVTGTNGKTTIMSLIEKIYSQAQQTAAIGTLGMSFGTQVRRSSLTTPEAVDLFPFLSKARKHGCTNLVMEVSSVALELHRVDDISFSQAVFSTFSGDHLDFHHSMENYFQAKLALFRGLNPGAWAAVNMDDSRGGQIIDELDCNFLTYGFAAEADIHPIKYKFSLNGIEAILNTPKGRLEIRSPLLGRINLLNLMAAVTSAIIKGIDFDLIARGIGAFKGVRGRLDVAYQNDISVLVDYAHTDKALEGLLMSLREVAHQRIVLVFGAGGSRDTGKRPRMGKVASECADYVVVTSDNPRGEEPEKIIQDIVAGFDQRFSNYAVELDRKAAIRRALAEAQRGDMVVIAGKGHEDYQIFKDKTIQFDDFEVIEEVLREKDA
jgi:UDP-N-acetylmuramoyl-L-alanyl-D-glutamate--2,6-diaminopimelate ligase